MGFLVSPGVQVKEIDLTNVVPAVAFVIPDSTRTTLRESVYCKKFAAVNQFSN